MSAAKSGSDRAPPAVPPETLEGWYALHQVFRLRRPELRRLRDDERIAIRENALTILERLVTPTIAPDETGSGWSAVVELAGSVAEVMVMHFRPTLDAIRAAQRQLACLILWEYLEPVYTFSSVTEAGLYHLTAALVREREAAGGVAGDAEYQRVLAERVTAERSTVHVARRLYPPRPADMPYVCFYPMSKRRAVGQNWYVLSLDERSRLMQAHGATGRRYAGRVQQVITGAIGLDAWEWGVTLFARDPLDFKKLVTEMRFDEVSAQYAEFGDFYVGRLVEPAEWVATLV